MAETFPTKSFSRIIKNDVGDEVLFIDFDDKTGIIKIRSERHISWLGDMFLSPELKIESLVDKEGRSCLIVSRVPCNTPKMTDGESKAMDIVLGWRRRCDLGITDLEELEKLRVHASKVKIL